MTDRWTDDLFVTMRSKGDSSADPLMDSVKGRDGLEMISEIFTHLVRNDDLPTEKLPPLVQQYIQDSSALPSWAEHDKLVLGSQAFNELGPDMVMLLFGASLPVVYAADPIAEVLSNTQRLTKHVLRRVVETAQFIMDVTDDNAFDPEGSGIRSTQKVRLMHAAVRHLMLYDPKWKDKWNPEWGIPINQVDLIGTLMSFSITVLQGLEKMNIRLPADKQEGYLHLWKVVGHLMGIRDELMPDDVQDAAALMDKWRQVNHVSSPSGQQLTKALIDLLQSFVGIYKPLIPAWVRFWVGKKTADLLAVQPYNWTISILQLERAIFFVLYRVESSSPFLLRFNRFISRKVLKGLLDFERGGDRTTFRLPYHMRSKLHL